MTDKLVLVYFLLFFLYVLFLFYINFVFFSIISLILELTTTHVFFFIDDSLFSPNFSNRFFTSNTWIHKNARIINELEREKLKY